MQRTGPSGLSVVVALIAGSAPLLTGGDGHAQATVVEHFNAPASPISDGAQLGVCGQLRARIAGGGSISVTGDGLARLATPSAGATAALASAAPLPMPPYEIRIDVDQLDYFSDGSTENGALLAALSWVAPQPHTQTWWRAQLAIAVWLGSETPTGRGARILYWDTLGTMYNWTASGFVPASDDPTPALTLEPAKTYAVRIDRDVSGWRISVSSGGATLALATVAAGEPRHGPHWFVAGEPFSGDCSGSLAVDAITLPRPLGCTAPSPDAGPPDGSPGVDGGGPPADSWPPPDGSWPPPDRSWPPGDSVGPSPGNEAGPPTGGAADLGFERIPRRSLDGCALGDRRPAAPGAGTLAGLLSLLGAIWLLRRRR